MHAAAAAKLFQSCPTLCDSIDGSPQGSAVPEFSRQEHWSGLPFPSPENLPNPGIEFRSPTLQADSLPTESLGKMPFFYDLKAILLFILFWDKEKERKRIVVYWS